MSSRKRTKRKNSEEDFDVDEGDDGLDIDEINRWACHSCTFVNRAAAFRCSVCGTRKGTSTRRSRCDDNVVEMQKNITDMVQKQVEKEKSLKRKERSMLKTSATRETSEEVTTTEVKLEELDVNSILENLKIPLPENTISIGNSRELTPKKEVETNGTSEPQESLIKLFTPPKSMESVREKSVTPIKKKSPKVSRESTPSNNGSPLKNIQSKCTEPTTSEILNNLDRSSITFPCSTSADITTFANSQNVNIITAEDHTPKPPPVSLDVPSTSISTVMPPSSANQADAVMQHLPERNVTTRNQQTPEDYKVLKSDESKTSVYPQVAELETVPNGWNQHKVKRESDPSVGSHQNVSPTTSRQSSETDSSSSEGNRSFEAPLFDASASVSKSCQIPDYMIHRETPQKIFIVANGFPAYFDEFPSRRH